MNRLITHNDMFRGVTPAMMIIEKFGEEAVAALMKEFNQLDQGAIPGKRVVCPVNPSTLTETERKRALNAVT